MTNSFVFDDDIEPYKHNFSGGPGKKDLLDRKGFAEQLTALVDRINDPMVIVLEGDWGSGKSYFLKLWTGSHGKEITGRSRLIYLDAFRHDYLDDPLVSLVSAITELRAEEEMPKGKINTAIGKIRTTAAKLALPAMRVGLAVGTAGVSEAAGALAKAAADSTGDEAVKAAETLWQREASRQRAFDDFRNALIELTDNDGQPRNIVIIVDELDRCRPDYALHMLEVAKHFFSVPRVHFVLGCNIDALEASVAHCYGLGKGAGRYLQKFVTLRAKLPDPAGSRACIHYLNRLYNEGRITERTHNNLCALLGNLQAQAHATLRDVNRILLRLRLLPIETDLLSWPAKWIVLVAVALEGLDHQFYLRFRARELKPFDVQSYLGVELPNFRHMQNTPQDQIGLVIEGYLRRDIEPELKSILKGNWAAHSGTSASDEFEHLLQEKLDGFTFFQPDSGRGKE